MISQRSPFLFTLIFLLLSVLLSSCSLLLESSEKINDDKHTLDDLQPAVNFYHPDEKNAWTELLAGTRVEDSMLKEQPFIASPQKALENYRALLEITQDSTIREKVLYRVAGLEMLLSEQQQADGATNSEGQLLAHYYDNAISNYKALLKQYPDRKDNDKILYQLAKAYELDGRSVDSLQTLNQLVAHYPESTYQVEAQFRRGEILFSRKEYHLAQQAYKAVIGSSDQGAFYQNAFYMHGWSLFKLNQYEPALRSFSTVMDQSLSKDISLAPTSKRKSGLLEDTLRIMSLIFSYLDGGDTVAQLYKELGARTYEYLLYDRLAQLLLTQERYGDTAKTYGKFIEKYPNSKWASRFHVKIIDIYADGHFPSRLLPEKERFVYRYGIHSAYWLAADEQTKEFIKPHLYSHILDLAQHYHAKAQNKKKTAAKNNIHNNEEVWLVYSVASKWYREFIDTFGQDEQVAKMLFLMAECQFEAHDYRAAIFSYENIAYALENHSRGSDAGYAAVLAHQYYYEALSDPEKIQNANWHKRMVDSQLRFTNHYANDTHAVEVLTNAAKELFELKDFSAAILAATKVSQWQPQAKDSLLLTAWLVVGHSQFEMQKYSQAERAFNQSLSLMNISKNMSTNKVKNNKHSEYNTTLELLAASIYRQGEQQLALGKNLIAVEHFLRIAEVAPKSPIRISAEFDAVTQLLTLKSWQRAIRVMIAFRKRYPTHKFTADIPARLAFAYQETRQWPLAANELMLIWKNDTAPQAQRQSLYLAGELYEKSGDIEMAIDAYRSYVSEYPAPFDVAIETRFKLSEFYLQTKQPNKRRFWLKKIIDEDAKAGNKRTNRSRYLAAMSSSVFLDDARRVFINIKLSLPLKRSLIKKKKALKKALSQYQKTVAYGVQEYATKATYYIGELYAQLSRDLIDSDRPAGLSDLELEQYEILLEEQAYPFEENAIDILEANSQQSWQGTYDQWVKSSFDSLAKLLPARYDKSERRATFSESIY